MALNVGTGIHLIEVKANLTVSASQQATADAVVGNRTLVIEPTHAAHDEEVTSLS